MIIKIVLFSEIFFGLLNLNIYFFFKIVLIECIVIEVIYYGDNDSE